MHVISFWAAVVLTALGAGSVGAQSIAKIGGPRELPPASYTGQSYIDSRGCVFLRAGFGGQINWVPRVSADRRPLCGYAPTFGPRVRVAVAEDAAVAAPTETVASLTTPPALPRARRVRTTVPEASYVAVPAQVATAQPPRVRPQPHYQVATGSGIPAGKIGCYSSAPVAVRLALRDGGSVVVCTRGDGTLTGARSPLYPAGSGVGASLSPPVQIATTEAGRPSGKRLRIAVAPPQDAPRALPKGYKLAWKDDRLNPNRGIGTAAGQAAQDQVWTRTVPARLVNEKQGRAKRAAVYSAAPDHVTVSSKSEPAAGAARVQARYVQVGTFGVPSNAEGAAARLAALGLPVRRAGVSKGGKALQIVLAGPFGDARQAQQALGAVRGAGFADAYLR